MSFIGNAGQDKERKSVEISFDYERKPGGGSNQYAVWIENDRNEVVKTLFVTSFTTKGRSRDGRPPRRGYTFRPACVPTWVSHSKVAEMSDEEVDGFTGATPQSGRKTFTWDFTDTAGNSVPKGTYKVCVEATLKDQHQIYFSGTVTNPGQPGEVTMESVERERNEAYAGMIQDVKVTVK